MAGKAWRKVENESGYPCYVNDTTGSQQFDHPQFIEVLESLAQYDNIKYKVYRVAFKVYAIKKLIKVPPLRITSGVFARHQLTLSECSLSLDLDELEGVLADIFFAAQKEGLFIGDIDLTVDLIINLLLNIFDSKRKEPIRVLSAKSLLIFLSDESCSDKWLALANCAADHNGCVSQKRLANLLSQVAALTSYLGEKEEDVQIDVDLCFSKSAGMLGLSASSVAEWAIDNCAITKWLTVLSRIHTSRTQAFGQICAGCSKPLVQVLKFKCSKCNELYLCEECYLFDRNMDNAAGHKRVHAVHELIDDHANIQHRCSFINGVRRFFFCNIKKKKLKSKTKKSTNSDGNKENERKKPAIFTSTVGKASGNSAGNPSSMLQDIIAQLEIQNRTLQELTDQLKKTGSDDENLKLKVETHWQQISTQINRLKILKENLSHNAQNIPTQPAAGMGKANLKAFDLFSPIPVLEKQTQSKIKEGLVNQPRVLSLDSGNFSVTSKNADVNVMTSAGDVIRPLAVNATSDSISAVSMNEISSWYNETQNQNLKTTKRHPDTTQDFSQSLCVTSQRYDADLRQVANSNVKMKELNADLDTVLDRLQQILSSHFACDDTCFDNTQLRETANEMEGLLGTLIRGVEERATLTATKGLI